MKFRINGREVVLTPEELADLPLEVKRELEVDGIRPYRFVSSEEDLPSADEVLGA